MPLEEYLAFFCIDDPEAELRTDVERGRDDDEGSLIDSRVAPLRYTAASAGLSLSLVSVTWYEDPRWALKGLEKLGGTGLLVEAALVRSCGTSFEPLEPGFRLVHLLSASHSAAWSGSIVNESAERFL